MPRLTKRYRGGKVPINPEWYDEWRALPCLLAQPKDCVYNVFSFLGLLSLEQAQKLAKMSPTGVPNEDILGFIQERYPDIPVHRVQQEDGETAPAFITRIADLLHDGFAYVFYFFEHIPDGNAHCVVLYKPVGALQILDPQLGKFGTIATPDDINQYIESIHQVYGRASPIKFGIFIPEQETEPLVAITETIKQRGIGSTVEQLYLAQGTVSQTEAKIAGQSASEHNWDEVRSNYKIKPYSAFPGEPGSVADIPFERLGLTHLHQVCFGVPLQIFNLEQNFLLVYVDKKFGQTYVYPSMLLAHIDSPTEITLYSVCTDPNFRGKGFLTGLLRTLEQYVSVNLPTITTYKLDCELRTLNKVPFLQRFFIYTRYGFCLYNDTTVTIQRAGFDGVLYDVHKTIYSSRYEDTNVIYSSRSPGSMKLQFFSYQSIVGIPQQPGLVEVVHPDGTREGVAVKMVVSRDILRQRLGLVPEPGGGAGASIGPGGAMPEEEYKGGTRKLRRGKKRKNTRRR